MRVNPEKKQKPKYLELWQKSIRKIMFHLHIIRLMKEYSLNRAMPLPHYLSWETNIFLDNEEENLNKLPFLILHPNRHPKEIWDLILGIVLIYIVIVVPFSMSFLDESSYSWMPSVDSSIDVLFLLDLLINLNTSFYDKDNNLITSRAKIFKNYLKNGFFVDLVSAFPFNLLDITVQGYTNLLRILRLRSITKLIKLSRLFKIVKTNENSILKEIQSFLSISHGFIRLLKFLAMIMISIHLSACLWHWCSSNQYFAPGTWVFESGLVDEPVYRRYLFSLYWSMTTLSTIGYGDIHPYSIIEKIIAIFWISFALYFLSFSISSLSSMLSQIDVKKTLLRQKMNFIDEFSKEIRLPKRLKKQLQNTLLKNIDRFSYSFYDRIELVGQLSKELKLEIAETMHKGLASRFQLFLEEDPNLLLEILPLMENLIMPGLQSVYSSGECSTKIYFIISGSVHFLLNNEKNVFQTYGDGNYFGDIDLILNIPRLNTAMTATECKFLIMGSDIIKKIKNFFPDFYDKLKKEAKLRYSASQKAKAEMKMILEANKKLTLKSKNMSAIRELISKEKISLERRESVLIDRMLSIENDKHCISETSLLIEESQDLLEKLHKILDKELETKSN